MKILFYIFIIGALFVIYIRFLERTSLFYPTRHLTATPDSLNLVYEEVYVTTQDQVKLHGWYIPSPRSRSTCVFFHGNAGSISDRLGKISMFHELGLGVLIVGYRGYGKSQGRPTEDGMYQDAQAIYDYAAHRGDIDKEKLVLYGASLGGVAAVDVASRHKVAAVILDSTFTNAKDMAKRYYPFIPSFFLTLKLDSLSKIKNVSAPKLFIHSQEDETVPYELGEKLFEAAEQPKVFLRIHGGHNDGHIYDEDNYVEGIQTFLKQHGLL